jgi:hypothetical protein
MNPSALPAVSVVMATYKRPALLARCLEAIGAQSLAAGDYEVVVVDDGRSADTRELVEATAARWQARGGPALRVLEPEGTRGPAGARNRGWRAAGAPVIAFTDDDTIPDRDWLREGLLALGEGDRVAVWGRVHVPLPERMTDNARNTAGLENATFVTANCFVRRVALERVGGFDERFTRAWREDTDLYFALLAAHPGAGRVAAAPRALVLHPVREAPFAVSVRQQANMFFDALLFKKYAGPYERLVGRRRAPGLYYAIAASTLLALVAAGPAPAFALGCAALAVALILVFAARRLRGLEKSPREVADVVLSSFAIPYLSLYWRVRGALRWRVRFF